MFDKLDGIVKKFEECNEQLIQPDILNNKAQYQKITKERAKLLPIVDAYQSYKKTLQEIDDNKQLLYDSDAEISKLAKAELDTLQPILVEKKRELEVLLLPKDPNDEKNVILEIRAGAGGDEASLFAGELFTMYSRFAQNKGWKVEAMSSSPGTMGGFKEIIATIEGNEVYSHLKFESGVHRVQRVPETETQGRIHTSTITVAVLPEAEEVDVHIDEKDLKIDVYRSSGPGGQSVNTTDSAVRVTHIPTGLVVACQDEKSQHKNKAKGIKILRSRLYEKMQAEQQAEIAQNRRSQIKTGDRSEKIRTYNFPQDRMTDHRIHLTIHNLPKILQGSIEDMIIQLRTHYQAELLQQAQI